MLEPPQTVRVAHTLARCETLGPGVRGVVWVQGCARGCPGCIAGPILGAGGVAVSTETLAARILGWPRIDGVTFSGGEPFEQAPALADVCRRLRRERPQLSLMAYSGFTLEELRASDAPGQSELLVLLDVLIDGPYVAASTGDLRWRGSTNQRVLRLTERHTESDLDAEGPGAGVELHVRPDGAMFWAGVPEPGFQAHLARSLRAEGIELQAMEGVWS